MKRKRIWLLLPIMMFMTGCASTTITEREGNYRYGKDEAIRILDIDTRDLVGTLTITGVRVLKKDFTIDEKLGTDASGQDVLVQIPYAQLVRIFYRYEATGADKTISGLHFDVRDAEGTMAKRDPVVDYEPEENTDSQSFVVALKNSGHTLHIDFRYDPLQSNPTARIELELEDVSLSASSSAPVSSSMSASNDTNTVTEKQQTTTAESFQPTSNQPAISAPSSLAETHTPRHDAAYLLMIAILSVAVLFLMATVVILAVNKR